MVLKGKKWFERVKNGPKMFNMVLNGLQCYQMVLNGLKKINHKFNWMAFITRFKLDHPNESGITRSPGLVFVVELVGGGSVIDGAYPV